MIPWLSPFNTDFPDTEQALKSPNGLLAAGGDLSPARLIQAYRHGIFPWYSEDEPILWWSPNPRCVLPPETLHISRSMRKHLRKAGWQLSFDEAFGDVIALCAQTRQHSGTWISPDIEAAYSQLHQQGIAHSVEVWDSDDRLIGGLYGLNFGQLFFGESMFSLATNASKAAFIGLALQLQRWSFPLIDCQVYNPHLATLGAHEIPRAEFREYIKLYIDVSTPQTWAFDDDLAQLRL